MNNLIDTMIIPGPQNGSNCLAAYACNDPLNTQASVMSFDE